MTTAFHRGEPFARHRDGRGESYEWVRYASKSRALNPFALSSSQNPEGYNKDVFLLRLAVLITKTKKSDEDDEG